MSYQVGDLVEVWSQFTDSKTKAVVVPDAVVCKVKDGNGAVSTPVVTKNLDDTYTAVADTSDASAQGDWRYRWFSTGAHQGASEGQFHVGPSSF